MQANAKEHALWAWLFTDEAAQQICNVLGEYLESISKHRPFLKKKKKFNPQKRVGKYSCHTRVCI
jgi:hypothetical protein